MFTNEPGSTRRFTPPAMKPLARDRRGDRRCPARRGALAAALVAVGLTIAACGGDDGGGSGGGSAKGGSLTIYSSLPLQGAARNQAVATVNGVKLKLKQVGNKVGKYTIKYVSLDDSTAARGGWDAGRTAENGRKAATDDAAIAYIGEFNSGRRVLLRRDAEYDDKNPDRYAVYGYEAISLILDAIQRAGAKGGDRAAVVEQIFATKDRELSLIHI